MSANNTELTATVGRAIVSGASSLRNFTLKLDDGTGLSLEATDDDHGVPAISASIVPAERLPALNEAVCSVDWSWIYGSLIQSISLDSKMVRLQLDNAGPLTISVGVWQGSSFLSFHPFRPAKK